MLKVKSNCIHRLILHIFLLTASLGFLNHRDKQAGTSDPWFSRINQQREIEPCTQQLEITLGNDDSNFVICLRLRLTPKNGC